jgi:hypothetical protein
LDAAAHCVEAVLVVGPVGGRETVNPLRGADDVGFSLSGRSFSRWWNLVCMAEGRVSSEVKSDKSERLVANFSEVDI